MDLRYEVSLLELLRAYDAARNELDYGEEGKSHYQTKLSKLLSLHFLDGSLTPKDIFATPTPLIEVYSAGNDLLSSYLDGTLKVDEPNFPFLEDQIERIESLKGESEMERSRLIRDVKGLIPYSEPIEITLFSGKIPVFYEKTNKANRRLLRELESEIVYYMRNGQEANLVEQ